MLSTVKSCKKISQIQLIWFYFRVLGFGLVTFTSLASENCYMYCSGDSKEILLLDLVILTEYLRCAVIVVSSNLSSRSLTKSTISLCLLLVCVDKPLSTP